VIEIIEQVGKPLMIKAYHNFALGLLVKLIRTPNDIYASLSLGKKPFGVVAGPPNQFKMIPVLYNSSTLLKLYYFENELSYSLGDLLYSNPWGRITSKKTYPNSIPIAFVEENLKENENLLKIRLI